MAEKHWTIDEHIALFQKNLPKLEKKYGKNKKLAYVEGKLVDNSPNYDVLERRARKMYPLKEIVIFYMYEPRAYTVLHGRSSL